MPRVDVERGSVELCIAYLGPEGAGKLAALEAVRRATEAGRATELISLNQNGDRTAMFDWVPNQRDALEGAQVLVRVRGLVGEARQRTTTERLLQGADAVVLVLHSGKAHGPANEQAAQRLFDDLSRQGQTLSTLPVVVQLNHADDPDPSSREELLRSIGMPDALCFESVASTGQGVVAALQCAYEQAARRAFQDPQTSGLRQRLEGERTSSKLDRIVGALDSLAERFVALHARVDAAHQTIDALKVDAEARERDMRSLRRALEEQTIGTRKLIHQTGETLKEAVAVVPVANDRLHQSVVERLDQLPLLRGELIADIRKELADLHDLSDSLREVDAQVRAGQGALHRDLQNLQESLEELSNDTRKRRGWFRSAGA